MDTVFANGIVPLNETQLQAAERARQWVKETIRERPDYLAGNGLSPDVWWPASNWNLGQPFYANAMRLIDGCDYSELRLLSSQFTGHSLDFQPTSVPDPYVVRRYTELRNTLPPCALSPPLVAGERGWLVGNQLINFDVIGYLER